MELIYLQGVLMDNGEILSMGKSIMFRSNIVVPIIKASDLSESTKAELDSKRNRKKL